MQKLTNEFKIEFTKGDTYALAIKFKNITEDLRLAYFSVKDNPDDAPLIQKSLGAGIEKIDDRDYKNEKTYKFQLQPADTVNLEAQTQYLYDIQVTIGNVVKTVLHGVFILRNTITGTRSVTASSLEIEVDDEVETELATTPATNGVEYEQDPVACAKIGDLTALLTTAKGTVVQAVNEVKNGVTTNTNDLYKIKNGILIVPKAKNAESAGDTTKINGIFTTEIFEEDGKVVKNATSAGKSANVYAKIGGKPINDIFEEDGKTVKKATNVENLPQTVLYDSGDKIGVEDWETALTNANIELLPNYRYVAICASGSHATYKDIYVLECFGKNLAMGVVGLTFHDFSVFDDIYWLREILISYTKSTKAFMCKKKQASVDSAGAVSYSSTFDYRLIKLIRCEKIYD